MLNFTPIGATVAEIPVTGQGKKQQTMADKQGPVFLTHSVFDGCERFRYLSASVSVEVISASTNTGTVYHQSQVSHRGNISDPPPDSSTDSAVIMDDGLSVWLVRRSGFWNSLPDSLQNPVFGGNSFRQSLRHFCSQRTNAFSSLEVSRDAIYKSTFNYFYLLTYLRIAASTLPSWTVASGPFRSRHRLSFSFIPDVAKDQSSTCIAGCRRMNLFAGRGIILT